VNPQRTALRVSATFASATYELIGSVVL
jgi:hypothetical protein